MSEYSDIQAAVEAGAAAVDIEKRFKIGELVNGRLIALTLTDDGSVKVEREMQNVIDRLAPGPVKRVGTATLHELDSFTDHVTRNKDDDRTTLWADANMFRVVAVYDDDPKGHAYDDAGWRQFRATYTCPTSEAWAAWTAMDGVELGQTELADFLEARIDDIDVPENDPAAPQAAQLLEMSRNLIINSAGRFKRSIDPTTGTGSLICETEHDKSSTKIPKAFYILIPVFDGGVAYRLKVAIRFRLVNNSRPEFTLSIQRRDAAKADAFGDVRKQITAETGLEVFAGTPPT